jgi:hypothetical protein
MKKLSHISVILIMILITDYVNTDNVTGQEKHNINKESCLIDTSINNFVLLRDLTPVIGELHFENCEPDCRKQYYNSDTTEILELYFYPGREKEQCSYFKVFECNQEAKKNNNIEVLQTKRFVSGKGIKISDNYEYIFSLFKQQKISINKTGTMKSIVFYGADQDTICNFNNYETSLYIGKYFFINDKLVSFEFGFEYP